MTQDQSQHPSLVTPLDVTKSAYVAPWWPFALGLLVGYIFFRPGGALEFILVRSGLKQSSPWAQTASTYGSPDIYGNRRLNVGQPGGGLPRGRGQNGNVFGFEDGNQLSNTSRNKGGGGGARSPSLNVASPRAFPGSESESTDSFNISPSPLYGGREGGGSLSPFEKGSRTSANPYLPDNDFFGR